MKKILAVFSVFLLSSAVAFAAVLPFSQGYAESVKKPLLVLVTAQWAENSAGILQTFKQAQNEFGDKFNYTELDIAKPDTKEFNKKFHIYPNLPYILMFRDGGRVSRYVPQECAGDYSCLSSKLKGFIQ